MVIYCFIIYLYLSFFFYNEVGGYKVQNIEGPWIPKEGKKEIKNRDWVSNEAWHPTCFTSCGMSFGGFYPTYSKAEAIGNFKIRNKINLCIY